MRRWPVSFMLLVIVAGALLPVSAGYAQSPESSPLVVFIEDTHLRTASLLDSGPDGITQLEQIFKDLGANTAWVTLDEPQPDEAQVVVMVRPLTALPADSLARIWLYLVRGRHLFLTTDPIGLSTELGEGDRVTRTNRTDSGLSILLTLFYGIQIEDTFLAEPWFTNATITSQNTTFLTTYAESIVEHPVTAPLARFDLPVQTLGRTLDPSGTIWHK